MAKKQIRVVQRAYWGKNLSFPNTTLKIPLVAQPLTNERNHINFHNACAEHTDTQLRRVDYCPKCSQQEKLKLETIFNQLNLNSETKEVLSPFVNEVFKTISYDNTAKIIEIPTPTGKQIISFTKAELDSIKTETESDLIAIGYGKVEQINPQHIGNTYALMPNLNAINDDGDYKRLLYALKESKYYIIVNYSDRGTTYKGVLIYYKDTNVTDKEFLMLVNLKDSKDLNEALEYKPTPTTNNDEIRGVIEFLGMALTPINFITETENEIEIKKRNLIALKLSGKPIPIARQIEQKPKPNVNGFQMAMRQIDRK